MAKRNKGNRAARGAAAVTSEAEAIVRRLIDDTHLRDAVENMLAKVGISDESEIVPEVKKKARFGAGKVVAVAGVAGAGALAVSQGLRTKVLDMLFGAEEEFEYTPPAPESTDAAAAADAGDGSGETGGPDGEAPNPPLSAV